MHVQNDKKRTRRNLTIFAVSVLGLTALAGIAEPLTVPPDAEPDASGLGQLLWLVAPLGVALLLRMFGGDGWANMGLRPNLKCNGLWWLVSVLVFPVVIGVTSVIGVVFGGLDLDTRMLTTLAAALATGLIPAMVKNVFEEFAWRGYLAPQVYSLNMNIWLSHAIVGIIWGAWHLPFVYVFWPYLSPSMMWYFVPLLILGTMSQSVVYGEIRLATGSVLPAWVMHTVGNALGNALLLSGAIRLRAGREVWASTGAEGIISIGIMFAVGYWLHQRRKKADQAH